MVIIESSICLMFVFKWQGTKLLALGPGDHQNWWPTCEGAPSGRTTVNPNWILLGYTHSSPGTRTRAHGLGSRRAILNAHRVANTRRNLSGRNSARSLGDGSQLDFSDLLSCRPVLIYIGPTAEFPELAQKSVSNFSNELCHSLVNSLFIICFSCNIFTFRAQNSKF